MNSIQQRTVDFVQRNNQQCLWSCQDITTIIGKSKWYLYGLIELRLSISRNLHATEIVCMTKVRWPVDSPIMKEGDRMPLTINLTSAGGGLVTQITLGGGGGGILAGGRIFSQQPSMLSSPVFSMVQLGGSFEAKSARRFQPIMIAIQEEVKDVIQLISAYGVSIQDTFQVLACWLSLMQVYVITKAQSWSLTLGSSLISDQL